MTPYAKHILKILREEEACKLGYKWARDWLKKQKAPGWTSFYNAIPRGRWLYWLMSNARRRYYADGRIFDKPVVAVDELTYTAEEIIERHELKDQCPCYSAASEEECLETCSEVCHPENCDHYGYWATEEDMLKSAKAYRKALPGRVAGKILRQVWGVR